MVAPVRPVTPTAVKVRNKEGAFDIQRVLKLGVICIAVVCCASIVVSKVLFNGFVYVASKDSSGNINRGVSHAFYKILSSLDKEGEVTCMNYGYMDLSRNAETIPLQAADEPERYCLQMYHKISSAAGDLTGKHVLEVGSGRGGGSSYTARYLHPSSMTGVDYTGIAVDFSNEKHAKTVPGLRYVQGDAQKLPFGDQDFDVVINVESSHCYKQFPDFVNEVYRVLKPGGKFSWVDLRDNEEGALKFVDETMKNAGFTQIFSQDVTDNVVAAMTKTGEQKKALIDRRVPRFARHIFYSFAGVQGTLLYEGLAKRNIVYTHKLLEKPL